MGKFDLSVHRSGGSICFEVRRWKGVSSSIEPSLPVAEEEPVDRSEIERALDQLELDKIKEQKDRLAEQISPLIESQKAHLVRSKSAYNANKPNVPKANLWHLRAWLTRAQQSAERNGRENMSIKKKISSIIEGYFK
ncbi:hypothetical protein HAX54_032428 [Datura stramonium]|uniref:Uncharacterized protein n=1 Tax=Datura stramonium TaxID=4076 RepID=A0ABS8VE77_DATST|nr:hypothetical protein [Datura stramonium]